MTSSPVQAGVERRPFGQLLGGPAVDLYVLTNARGLSAGVATYGGVVTSLVVPDARGRLGDVVLGFDGLDGYLGQSPYFGALIGRVGNRMARGRFTLDGVTYQLGCNNEPNHLHGGWRAFDKAIWSARPAHTDGRSAVVLTLHAPHGHEGYPGNLDVEVTYALTDDAALEIDYRATTDRRTLCNLTHHGYFNLEGAGEGDILGHELMLNADRYTPVDRTLIPTGELAAVEGTPFDFRKPTALGARIRQEDAQLRCGQGYDHNFVLSRAGTGLELAARVRAPRSGRVMEVWTTEPGVQLYSGNFLDGTITGKGGKVYGRNAAFCLETQHFPDAPNHPNFPSIVLDPGTEYRTRTVYRFGVG